METPKTGFLMTRPIYKALNHHVAVSVLCLFLVLQRVGLQPVIVVFSSYIIVVPWVVHLYVEIIHEL